MDASGNIIDLSGNVIDPVTQVLMQIGNQNLNVGEIPIDREGVKSLDIIWESSLDKVTWTNIASQQVNYRLTSKEYLKYIRATITLVDKEDHTESYSLPSTIIEKSILFVEEQVVVCNNDETANIFYQQT